MTLLVQRLILVYLRRRRTPTDLPAILRARGVGVRCSRSQQNSAHQLMSRLEERRLVTKVQPGGGKPASYALTPAGEALAVKFEAYLARLDSARGAMERALEVTSSTVRQKKAPLASHLAPGGNQKSPARKVFECPRCATAITVRNLRQRLGQAEQFTCEGCGQELTEAACEFLDKISEHP